MNHYRFSSPSLIRGAEFHEVADCSPIALIRADAAASREQVFAIRQSLEARDWLCVPVTKDGGHALQVCGFGDEKELIDLLVQHGYAQGASQITGLPREKPSVQKPGFFKRYSLKLAGAFNMIGDVGLLSKGFSSGSTFTAAAGGFYTMGGANLALFGNAAPDHPSLVDRTANFFQRKIGELPPHSGLSELQKHATARARLKNNLRSHAANVTLASYSAGAAVMLAQGIKEFREERVKLRAGEIGSGNTKGWSLISYGASSLVFKILSLIILESSPEEDADQPQGLAHRCIGWVREKPMRLFGYGSLITDSLLAVRAWQEYKTGVKKDYLWTALTSVTYMASDFLAAISSKKTGPALLSEDERRGVIALAAETIALEPQEKQVSLTQDVSAYLEKQPEMKKPGSDIAGAIRRNIENLAQSPWAIRTQQTPALETSR